MEKIKVYEVMQEEKVIGAMGIIKDYKIDCGSLVKCEGVTTGLSLNRKHEVKRDKFYNAILTHWFNGINTEQLNEIISQDDYLGLKFKYVKDSELKYNN